jgi:restriction endonuclease S subunit
VKFGDIASSITERVDDPSAAGVDRYVGLEHLDPDATAIRRWGSPSDVESTKLRFYPGDVIYGRRRAYQRKLGVADFDGICSAHALVLRARPAVCLPEFLPYFLQSDAFHQRALDISVGSLSPTINWKTLAVQEFALPPLDEQQRIVEVLSASLKVVYAYDRLASVNFLDALFTKNTKVPVRRVSDICEVNPESREDLELVKWPMSYIDISAVSFGGGIDPSLVFAVDAESAPSRAQRVVRTGDVLLSTVRPELRAMGIVPVSLEGSLASTGFVVLRPASDVERYFVWGLIRSRRFTAAMVSAATGTNYPAVRGSDVAGFTFCDNGEDARQVIASLVGVSTCVDESCRRARETALLAYKSLRERLMRVSDVH